MCICGKRACNIERLVGGGVRLIRTVIKAGWTDGGECAGSS